MIWNVFMLALCCWREAQNQSAAVIIDVACSIRNRTRAPSWWNSKTVGNYVAVILQPSQYSSFNWGDPNVRKLPLTTDPVFSTCLQIAQSVYDDSQADTVDGAQSYIDRTIWDNPPEWVKTMTMVKESGDFRFYKV